MGGKKRFLVISAFLILFLIIGTLAFVFSKPQTTELSNSSDLGKRVPNIMVLGMDEKNYPLRELVEENSKQGIRTIVSLWATWCDPCRRELPLLQKAKQSLKENKIEVVLINYDDGPPERAIPEVKAWLIANQIQELASFFDFKQDLMNQLQVSALPYAFAVDESSKIIWIKLGELNWNPKELFP